MTPAEYAEGIDKLKRWFQVPYIFDEDTSAELFERIKSMPKTWFLAVIEKFTTRWEKSFPPRPVDFMNEYGVWERHARAERSAAEARYNRTVEDMKPKISPEESLRRLSTIGVTSMVDAVEKIARGQLTPEEIQSALSGEVGA